MIIDWSNRELYNEKYIPLLKDEKRYIFMIGGGGSGKSVFASQKEIIKSYTKGNRCLCIRKVKDTLKESVFQELKSRIEEYKLGEHFHITESPMYIKNKLTGSDFIFRGLDDVEKIKSVAKVTRAWVEEGSEVTKKDFDQLDLRLRGSKQLQITLTTNPINEDLWINKDFWEKGETSTVTLCHSTFLDNRWVGDEYKRVMERLKEENLQYYNIYALGLWGSNLEGLVFPKYETIEAVPLGAKFVSYGLDFGYENDPTTLVGVWQADDKRFYQEFFYEKKLLFSEIADKLDRLGIDRSDQIFCDNARPEGIEELHRRGYNAKKCTKGADSINYGISLMKEKTIIVVDTSLNLIKELRNHVWMEDKNGDLLNKPEDKWNHCFSGSTKVKTLDGDKFIKNVTTNDKVLTSEGYKQVLRRWDNGLKQTYKFSLQLDTETVELICTPDHKIKTTEGWMEISKLKSGQMVFLCNSLEKESIISTQMRGIFQKEEAECTGSCGKSIMEKSHMDTTSIIKMKTHGTIGLKTLNLWKGGHMFQCLQSFTTRGIQVLLGKISQKTKTSVGPGTRVTKEGIGTKNMEKSVGKTRHTEPLCVQSVEKVMKQGRLGNRNTVIRTARLVHIEKVLNKKQPVYDLFIEGCHEYFANGVLVHNCLDACRYAIMSTQKKKTGYKSNVSSFIVR